MKLHVSKLDIKDDESDDGQLVGMVCSETAVITCKCCSNVFYAKHYEKHNCFREELNKLMTNKVTINKFSIDIGEKKKQFTLGNNTHVSSLSTSITRNHFPEKDCVFGIIFGIKPVVRKIWRIPYMFYKFYSGKSLDRRVCLTKFHK